MSDLTDFERRHILGMDARLAMATMAAMAHFIAEAKSPRDYELIQRAVLGFTATALLSLRATSRRDLPDEDRDARRAGLQQFSADELLPMFGEILREEIERIARPKSERDAIVESAIVRAGGGKAH